MNKVALAALASMFLLIAPASTAVEESAAFTVGDKWVLGQEFDLMEEFDSVTDEIFEVLDAEIENNSTGEYDDLMGYSLDKNEGVIGVFYTGEIVDDLDGLIHIRSEESFYFHTAIDSSITGVVFEEGTYDDVEEKCVYDEENDDETCTYTLADGSEMPTAVQTMEIGGEFHYVTQITTETWWTQDDFDMQKMDLTLSMGMSGGVKLNNIPNETMEPNWIEEDYDGDGYPDGEREDCEYDDETNEETCTYEYISTVMETAELGASAEESLHLLFEFDPWQPLNAFDLPLEENKYWEGQTEVRISGDVGGVIDIDKPVLSICPDLDCDQLPEMQALYEGMTAGIEELHNNETFSITVDRDNDGQPDVIEKWDDIFPLYIPETWMDSIFQAILEAVSCEDDESAQEGEECDETAEEELEKLDLRIENNRFAFGPYDVPTEIPYAFETGEEMSGWGVDGTAHQGFQVFPSDGCSENNPNRNDDECERDDEEHEEEDDEDDPFMGDDDDSRSSHDDDCDPEYEDCDDYDCTEDDTPDPFCEATMEYFHDAETGQVSFIEMDMPHAKDDGYKVTMSAVKDKQVVEAMEDKIDANADPTEPEKNEATSAPESIEEDDFPLPGFGVMAAVGSLMLAGRRFRR